MPDTSCCPELINDRASASLDTCGGCSARHLGVDYVCDYGQYRQELSNRASLLHEFRPDWVLLALDAYHLAAPFHAGLSKAEVDARFRVGPRLQENQNEHGHPREENVGSARRFARVFVLFHSNYSDESAESLRQAAHAVNRRACRRTRSRSRHGSSVLKPPPTQPHKEQQHARTTVRGLSAAPAGVPLHGGKASRQSACHPDKGLRARPSYQS